MQAMWLGRLGLTALVAGIVATSGGMVGCAEERDPINRVQLNAIPKSFFVGQNYSDPADDPEFYARTMVVGAPYGESGADWGLFTNSINSVSKIKWQVQERFLLGRVSFERIDGTDEKGPTPEVRDRDPKKPLAQNEGLVVYQFPIVSQFDIRRDYNPQTGEESNVIVENSTDRPWIDRDYVRVDFSQNLVTTAYDFDTMSLLGIYGNIKWTSMPFDVQNPKDKDAPVIDTASGYFDVTNKAFAAPQMLNVWGVTFPGCLLPNVIRGGTEPVGNCNPNEITLRHSFKRVVDTDYEPVNWDGQRFETYGAFLEERNGYARDYGMVDRMWRRYIARYNVWERSHYYTDPDRMEGATSCLSDFDCEDIGAAPGISHCDLANAKCTLPYSDRKVKPIVWHYAAGSTPEYFDATREASEEWDTAMRVAVLTAKYAECKRYTPTADCGIVPDGNFADEEDAMYLVKEVQACRRGDVPGVAQTASDCNNYAVEVAQKRGYSEAAITVAQMDPVVFLCHSPVSEKDPKYCGKAGTVARLGDLRYHLVTSVPTPETGSPWGIMSDANDPVTGERVSASINIWTHVNDLFARGLVDTLRYIGGELKTEDVTDGTNVNQWVEAARNLNGVGLAPVMPKADREKRIAAATGTTVDKLRAAHAAAAKPTADMLAAKKALMDVGKRVAQTRAALDAPSMNAPIYEQRRQQLVGSPVEAQLTTPAMQQLASAGFGSVALDTATKTQATSVLQGLNPKVQRELQQRLELGLAARGACIMNYEATAPLGYIGFGDVLQEKFGRFNPNDAPAVQLERANRMSDWIRRRAHYAVIAHEMGHSFGLRHNFVSSSDAWNFRPQYWQLRTNDKAVSKAFCADDTTDGGSCVGPRWLDPVTPNETRNLIQMWAQSSTMEYPGEPTQDLLGLGAYDFGAARMFYGDAVTVYGEDRFTDTARTRGTYGQTGYTVALEHMNDFGGLLGFRFGEWGNWIPYAHLDGEFDLISDCKRINPEDFRPGNWNEAKDGAWSRLVDGHIVTNEGGQTTKCKMPKVDYVQWSEMKDVGAGTGAKTHAVDRHGRIRVPHSFASDEWADLGNIAVFRHDNGADIYETMHFWIAQQEMMHIFSSYRRGRRDFSVWGAFQRNLTRYHEKMRDSGKSIGLYVTLAKDTVALYNSGNDPLAFVADVLGEIAEDNVVASTIAFDHFAHVFARPQPGQHGRIGTGDPILRSFESTGFAQTNRASLSIANGVQGGFGAISLGGRPIENALANNQGRDFDRDYTLNCGSYYEKAYTAYLFSESADNFISSSRDDFVDPRFRAVSLADVFTDGYRRWLANNLTGDDELKGVLVRGQAGGPLGPPDLDSNSYATIGQTSWWPTGGIEACFPQGERITCRNPFDPLVGGPTIDQATVVDPQVGWEQQKFAMLFSLLHLSDNQKSYWIDQMQIYSLGNGADPSFPNRIELHDPTGRIFVAKTFGKEALFGKTVQKGVAARVLEYANQLLRDAVVTEPITQGDTTWYKPLLTPEGKVQYQRSLKTGGFEPVATCEESRECVKLKNYMSVPMLLDEIMHYLGYIPFGGIKGVY